jgi:predicted lipoprotein with Yx(FWY)xxD motif
MNKMIPVLFALALALPGAALAKGPGSFKKGMLTDKKGMTLYTTDKDAVNSGKSTCNGPCAKNWPPFLAPEKTKPAGDWTLATRDDGKMQWSFKGWPVYTYAQDKKAGDTTGDGVGGVWHVVKQAASSAPAAKPAADPKADTGYKSTN